MSRLYLFNWGIMVFLPFQECFPFFKYGHSLYLNRWDNERTIFHGNLWFLPHLTYLHKEGSQSF